MKRIFVPILLATVPAGAAAVNTTPAEAFCCPAVTTGTLVPVSPPIRPRTTGRVEINECMGLSFLHIIVRANVPDGTQFMAVIPPASPLGQPQMSDWINMTGGRGEIVWQGVTQAGVPSGGLAGRTMMIVDSNFTDLASVKF